MELNWENLDLCIRSCQACPLAFGCTQKVPGQGDRHSPLMLIGEGPGEVEDREGMAFVGPAGQLLTRMLAAISLPRERVFICNVVKCRPPNNRQPLPEERAACLSHLRAQTALIRPKVILLLGATAVNTVLGNEYRITRCRGQWFERKNCSIIATYHPSALLRDPSKKRDSWEDLKKLRNRLIELSLYTDIYGTEESHDGTVS